MDACWDILVGIWAAIPKEVLGGCITVLLTAYIAYLYALRRYFKQKEYELILKRYLTEGIDVISKQVENAARVFFYNYTTAVDILSRLEILKKSAPPEKFLNIQPYLGFLPLHKLRYLLGDDILAESIQNLLLFVNANGRRLNTSFHGDTLEIERQLQSHQEAKLLELLKSIKSQIDEDYEIFVKFAFVQTILHRITSILEKEKALTWANLDEFKNRSDIKECLKDAHEGLTTIKNKLEALLSSED